MGVSSATPGVQRVGVSLSVVIPAYNEEEILAESVAAVVTALRDSDASGSFEVIISENGSIDGTRALAHELAGTYDEVRVLESDVADYGAALREGFHAATGDFVVSFDADYYDFSFLRQALELDADIVVGAKGMPGSEDNRVILRRLVSRSFSLVVRRLLHVRTTETHGMKLFRRAAIEPLLPHVRASKDLFDTELLARAERNGLTIAELPVRTEELREPRSSIGARIPRTVWGLMQLRRRLRREYPTGADRTRGAAGPPSERALALGADAAFGRRLLVVGSAAGPIRGADESFLSLDESGVVVLVVVLRALAPGVGSDIADTLDGVAAAAPEELCAPTGVPGHAAALADAHARYFGAQGGQRGLNRDQQAVVVLREEPDTAGWEELIVEVGGQLAGVYRDDGDELVPLAVPAELRREEGRREPRRRVRTLLTGLAILAVGLAVGAGAGVVVDDDGSATTAAPTAGSLVRPVASAVPAAATHNQWIGQDHLVRTSDGTLLAVYGTEQGLQIVADHANHGRAWQPAAAVPEIRAAASSVAVDDRDRLHVAFSDGDRVHYAVVEQRDGTWASTATVELDASTTPYIDVAYDEAAGLAHVVWVGETPDGQAPQWAAISAQDGEAAPVQRGPLAPPATDIPVLVNVAADRASTVVATYRRGDSPFGWYARDLAANPEGGLAWGPEERLAPDVGIGAGAVVVDETGRVHLVLRDSTTFALVYFTRDPGGAWSAGETAVDAESIEEIDFPSLTVDPASRLVYLFYQSDQTSPAPGVQVAVRDPAAGWQAPFPASSADAAPAGAAFPAAIANAAGPPVVLWTAAGAAPSLQSTVITP